MKILITKDQNEKYRVHFPSKVETYSKLEKAVNDAKFEILNKKFSKLNFNFQISDNEFLFDEVVYI